MTVVVNDASRKASETNPPFTYEVLGQLVSGDTLAQAVTGTPTYSTTAGTSSGQFPITVTGLVSANYDLAFLPGTLTVTTDAAGVTTTTSLTASASQTQYGDPVTFTATVLPGAATGSVAFFDGSTLIGFGVLSGGVATFTTSSLAAGVHDSITADYLGNETYSSSVSGPVMVTVAKRTGPGPNGAALVVTVQNATRLVGTANPQFHYLATGALVNNETYATAITGVPVYTTDADISSPAGSLHPVNITGGLSSANYEIAFVAGTLAIVGAGSTTALTVDHPQIQYSDAVTFTDTVAPVQATGTVLFFEGKDVAGSGTLSNGVATFTTRALIVGQHTIEAVYLGDSTYGGSTSGEVIVVVLQRRMPDGTATLTVTVSDATRSVGRSNPPFTYTVTGTLIGTDTYTTALQGLPFFLTQANLVSPTGTYPIGLLGLSSRNYSIKIVTGTLTVTDNRQPVNPAIGPTVVPYGGSTTVSVVPTNPTPNKPTGTVDVRIDGGNPITLSLDANGQAALPLASLLPGPHSIDVFYPGDLNFIPATTSRVITIQKVPTVTTLSSSSPSAPVGTPVTFTAQVSSSSTGLPLPSGTVTVYSDGVAIGTSTINASEVAIFTTSTLALGTHAISAVYGGDTSYLTSTSVPVTQTITVITADFSVKSNTGPQIIPPGASATYDIVVGPVGSSFNNLVTMSATNLPPGATYTYTPSAVTPGVPGAHTNFTVSVPKQSTSARRTRSFPSAALALLLLPLATIRRYRNGVFRTLLFALIALSSFMAMSGCGVGGYFSLPEQTYVITVTGTSGNLVHSTTVTLTVQ